MLEAQREDRAAIQDDEDLDAIGVDGADAAEDGEAREAEQSALRAWRE